MKCSHILIVLGLSCVHGAQVYMEFNGHKYAYNTDKDAYGGHSALSPNYDYQNQQSIIGLNTPVVSYNPLQFVQQSLSTMRRPTTVYNAYNNHHHQQQQQQHQHQQQQQQIEHQLNEPINRNFDFSTHQMSHSQHTDQSGHVVGKYSYYDAAGYHELSYKAGAGIGFVVMGGNLAKATTEQPSQITEIQTNDLSSATNFDHMHRRFFRK